MQRGVTLNLLGSLGCLAFGVGGMAGGYGGEAVLQSPAWGVIPVASILLLGFGAYLQLTGSSRSGGKSDFLPFPKPGDLRRRKIRLPTDVGDS